MKRVSGCVRFAATRSASPSLLSTKIKSVSATADTLKHYQDFMRIAEVCLREICVGIHYKYRLVVGRDEVRMAIAS
jgi:hypothetical protein